MLCSGKYWSLTQFNIYKIYFRFYILYICISTVHFYLSPCVSAPQVFIWFLSATSAYISEGGNAGWNGWVYLTSFFFIFSFKLFWRRGKYRFAKHCLFLHKPNSLCLNKRKWLLYCLCKSDLRLQHTENTALPDSVPHCHFERDGS